MLSAMALLWVVLLDILFVVVLGLLIWPLAHYRRASYAVLRRNFVGYFSNPTGYVFLCIFVLLTSVAAFWPHDFWSANLANLDQLNKYLPYIMLVFIPAITMSIWAEEKRQGTDELLLTLPADDFDIVVGKYLAAAAIFTASLLFSQLASCAVLISLTLGDLDVGLLVTTYFGYWLIGLAMLAIGMVASFLTSNLTVGFILGAAFNLPLAFAAKVDVIAPTRGRFGIIDWQTVSTAISRWSVSSQFEGFGRGVVNLSSVTFFVMLGVIGLYLSMVLIGKRHWSGGRDGTSRLGHYLLRVLALFIIAAGVNVFFTNYDILRVDATDAKISSLSKQTKTLLRELNAPHTIYVDAYLSGDVPEEFVQTKYDLLSMLKEFRALSDSTITVNIYDDLEPSSEEAAQAQERFGISPQAVRSFSQGTITDKEIILGAAFTCGLDKVVVPFFEPGVPVEYELVRSINTVVKPKRKKLGVLRTDAQITGGFSFAGGMPQQIPRQEILDELEKQYDIEEIAPTDEIEVEKLDALLVVQPSSLEPAGLDNLIAAINKGLPTAIFEDPRPIPQIFGTRFPGTGEPKPRQNPMMGMGGGPPPPKGDIKNLWDALGINMPGEMGEGFPPLYQPDIAWQQYNPYPRLQLDFITDEWVFVSPSAPGAKEAFNPNDPVVSGLDEVLFLMPGAVEKTKNSKFDFIPLARSAADISGLTPMDEMMNPQRNLALQKTPGEEPLVLAARITGDLPAAAKDETDATGDTEEAEESGEDDAAADDEGASDGDNETDGQDAGAEDKRQQDGRKRDKLNVIYVCDADCMGSPFLRIRARPGEAGDIQWRFENVTFLLNIIDSLAGEDSYMDIRKRKFRHSTLRMVEESTANARRREEEQRKQFQSKYDKALAEAEKKNEEIEKKFQDKYDQLVQKQQRGEAVNPAEIRGAQMQLIEQKAKNERQLAVERERLERERDLQIKKIALEVDREIKAIQKRYKYIAVIVPPIPPLLVGLVVFVRRRLREREGVARSRMRF